MPSTTKNAANAMSHEARVATPAYATQNATSATAPASEPIAAAAANVVPRSSARKNAIGPEVSGNPTSQPLIACPQRRAARLAPPINAGVSTSLSSRVSTSRRTYPKAARSPSRLSYGPSAHGHPLPSIDLRRDARDRAGASRRRPSRALSLHRQRRRHAREGDARREPRLSAHRRDRPHGGDAGDEHAGSAAARRRARAGRRDPADSGSAHLHGPALCASCRRDDERHVHARRHRVGGV